MPDFRDPLGDAAFERSLLESARGDVGPDDGQAALARLAGSLGQVIPRPPLALDGSRTPAEAPPAPTGTPWAAATRWLLIGALGGGGLVAGATARRHLGPDLPPVLARPAPAPGPVSRSAEGLPAPPVVTPAPPPPGAGRHRLAAASASRSVDQGGSHDSSTLAAEVARIDAARTAAALGDYEETIRLVDRYQRDFPQGALAPDAEVVALEALTARGDRSRLAERAARFLARHPADPHAARVARLARSVPP